MPDFRDIDPRELRLPSRRGADPFRFQRQTARFGASTAGRPPPWAFEASGGVRVVFYGITRATRIAKLAPGTMIRVEVRASCVGFITASSRSEISFHENHYITIESIDKLADVHQLSPDIRVGLLPANLGFLVEDQTDSSLRDVEDAQILAVMEKHRIDLARRLTDA